MLAIRLKRIGRKNDPSFRVVVQDHRRSPKKTRGICEYVGFYDARKGKPQLNADRIQYWIAHGAKASDTVHNLLVDAKIVSGKKVNAKNKKTPVKKESPAAETTAASPVVPEHSASKVEAKAEETLSATSEEETKAV